MYIYKITNLINGKIYIGQTIQKNPKMRWYGHLADARSNKRKGHLQNSLNKYGAENFHWEIIDWANSLEILNLKEKEWLSYFKETTKVYNLREAGGNKLHSEQSIEKMRESQKKAHARRKLLGTDTWKRRDGGSMKGRLHPKKGKPSKKWSEEAKARYSLIAKEREARKKTLAKEK
jgi:group I intron endonuclease